MFLYFLIIRYAIYVIVNLYLTIAFVCCIAFIKCEISVNSGDKTIIIIIRSIII